MSQATHWPLKAFPPRSDGPGMGVPDPACPVCDADLMFAGDERAGDLVHCTFCGAPFLLRERPRRPDEDEARWELEEDL